MIEKIKKKIFIILQEKKISLRFSHQFRNKLNKIKNSHTKIRLYKQILKIVENPYIGKPLKYSRKGSREVYLDSLRLYYAYYSEEKILRIVEFSHKDEQ